MLTEALPSWVFPAAWLPTRVKESVQAQQSDTALRLHSRCFECPRNKTCCRYRADDHDWSFDRLERRIAVRYATGEITPLSEDPTPEERVAYWQHFFSSVYV